jgi:hypothetical protein
MDRAPPRLGLTALFKIGFSKCEDNRFVSPGCFSKSAQKEELNKKSDNTRVFSLDIKASLLAL